MELLLGPGKGIDSGEEVDGVLGALGEGTPGLFDQFEEDRGDTDLFGEVGLSEARRSAGVGAPALHRVEQRADAV